MSAQLNGLVINVPKFQHAVCKRCLYWNNFGAGRWLFVWLFKLACTQTLHFCPIYYCPICNVTAIANADPTPCQWNSYSVSLKSQLICWSACCPIYYCPIYMVPTNYTQISVHPQKKGQRIQCCIRLAIHFLGDTPQCFTQSSNDSQNEKLKCKWDLQCL